MYIHISRTGLLLTRLLEFVWSQNFGSLLVMSTEANVHTPIHRQTSMSQS